MFINMKTSKAIKKIASLCVLKNNNKFLLLKRFNEPNKDRYVPVGGKIQAFESTYDCAIRETFEETGIKIEKPEFYGIITETSPTEYNWISYVYSREIDLINEPKSNEGILEWVDYKNISELPTPKTDDIIYKYILEKKKFIISVEYNDKIEIISMKEELENKKLFC